MLVTSIFSFSLNAFKRPLFQGRYSTDTHFDASTTAFENIVGKEEIAYNEQFLLFPQCFLLNQIIVPPFVHIFHISLFAAEFEEPKIGISDKGLKNDYSLW